MNAADFRQFADKVKAELPDGREKALVLTKIDEARMWFSEAMVKVAAKEVSK